jgi:hypothetical protein
MHCPLAAFRQWSRCPSSSMNARSRIDVNGEKPLVCKADFKPPIENASEQFLAPSASCPEAFPIKTNDFPDRWMLGVVRERCGHVLACCQNRLTTRPELPRVTILEVRRPRSTHHILHLGSAYQVRVAAWLAVEMLAEGQGRPFSPGGASPVSRRNAGVGMTFGRYGRRAIRLFKRSESSRSQTGRIANLRRSIDQAIRQIAPPATMNGSRPWSRSPPLYNSSLPLEAPVMEKDIDT